MKKIIYLILTIAFLSSCKSEPKESTPTQMEEVIAIHDEVMPKMQEINKLIETLKPMADSTETGMEYGKAMKDLQNAHASMMEWMKGFGNRFSSAEILDGQELSDEKKIWLDEEEVKVKEMQSEVLSSIENANKLLESKQ